MVRTDAIVLGAGIIGTSIALALVKRGLSVALVDRRGPGEGTSYGNTGVIGGAGVYPTAFPRRLSKLLRVALKRAPEANYHFGFLPRISPWLFAYFRASSPQRLEETARLMRPLMARSVAEHEELMLGVERDRLSAPHRLDLAISHRTRFHWLAPELDLGAELGVHADVLSTDATRALEPNLAPVFRGAVHWPDVASISNPLAVTQRYARRFSALGGIFLNGDAQSLRRSAGAWRIDADGGRGRCRSSRGRARPLGARHPRAARHPVCRWRSSAAITGISSRKAIAG